MIDDSMREIVNDFVQEALEFLESLNENFIELEKQPENKEILNTIFRATHTIKGSAGFLGFQNIVGLAHGAENILNKLRQGEARLTSEMADYLLKSIDMLRTMILTVSETGAEGRFLDGYEELVKTLDAFSEGCGAAGPAGSRDSSARRSYAAPLASTADENAHAENQKTALEPDTASIQTVSSDASGALTTVRDSGVSGKKKTRNLGDILLENSLIPKEELDEICMEKEEEERKGYKTEKEETVSAAQIPQFDAEEIVDSAPAAKKPAPIKHISSVSKNTAAAKVPVTATQKPAIVRPAAPAAEFKETAIRVDIERLDDVMNLVGELVLARNRLFNISSKLEVKYAGDDLSSALAQVVSGLNLVTTDLQLAVMKTRMQPVKKVFSKFPRMVRNLSRELGKDIELLIAGEETELDKSVIKEIGDPLVHLIRNSVDHGIEDKKTRKLNGKQEKGTIKLIAKHEGNYVIISVIDDGKGMNPALIKRKAIEKGVIDKKTAAGMTDKDALNLIFAPGFSTKDKATEISGRGVGMDVVKTNIQKLNGIIEVNSESGMGSSIILKLPLTVAIIQTLIVGIAGDVFAIPLNSIVETLRIKEQAIRTIDKHEVINLRKSVLSLIRLGEEFGIGGSADYDYKKSGQSEKEIYVVVVAFAEKNVGIVVDKLFGQEEVVIKSLGDYRLGYGGISGATITGDGKVVLIIDVASMIDAVKIRQSQN